MAWVRFLAEAREFSILHSVQAGSGAYPTYTVGTSGSFSEGKAAGA
jgi:hypothetical protein